MNEPRVEGIAIIGATGRFPGAGSVEEFWANLSAGRETISVFADKELTASGLDVEALKVAGNYVPARGVLKDPDCFDAGFFGIHPNEAQVMDPQQRLFLEGCWEALERAGYVPGQIEGSVGVYAGATFNTYYLHALNHRRDLIELMGREQVMLGNEKDYIATRVAYKLNLKGPAISLNTACSSSLVAVCQACQALLTYQCDMALAGGVSVRVPQNSGYYYQEGNIGSPDGHTRTFDEQARGTVFSNGIGIVVLKRLDEALEAGDQIYAVIKSAALNNDGSQRVSFGAPGVEGQSQVIALAHALAGVDADTISYVEAHGTATPLGDPIEVAALTKAFRLSTQRKQFCAIGSVKSNIGHLDAAAGVAGLIKTALALQHKFLPASLHFTRPNPKLELQDSPFFVCETSRPWGTEDVPLRAGVSSFGTGGTNAHVVLEEAPNLPPPGPSCPLQVLPLSAKTSAALEAATTNLGECFKGQPRMNLADAAFTLQVGRSHFAHRRFAVCRNPEDAVMALDSGDPKRVFTGQSRLQDPSVIFMFPGQGAQYVSMGAELYHTESVFREVVDHCSERLEPILDLDLRLPLYPAAGEESAARELLIQTRVTQPALFVTEYALARLWMSWGVKPAAMIGHSVGEYVAGCLAGVFSLEQALQLVARRAQLVQSLPGGAMLAVRLGENEVASLVNGQISIAAVNSSSLCVVSGPFAAVEELEKVLEGKGTVGRRLHTSHAFHSMMMDPAIEPFRQLLSRTQLSAPQVRYVSNVTGKWITAGESTSPDYWAGHLRQCVRFADGLAELTKDPESILLEVGPGQTLATLARQHPGRSPQQLVLSSLPSKDEEFRGLLETLGRLWLMGVKVDWSGLHSGERRRRVVLPTYPFDRKRYWPDAPASTPVPVRSEASQDDAVPSFLAPKAALAQAATPEDRVPPGPIVSRKDHLIALVRSQFQDLSGASLEGIECQASLLEMGFDSLLLTQAAQLLQNKFGVKVTFRQLMEELESLEAIGTFLDSQLPAEAFQPEIARSKAPSVPTAVASSPATPLAPGVPTPAIEEILRQQLRVTTQLLEMLGTKAPASASPREEAAAVQLTGPTRGAGHTSVPRVESQAHGPFRPVDRGTGGLTEQQERHLQELIARYTRRTAGSKRLAEQHRPYLADPRSAAGFKQLWKEMVYPIVTTRSEGSKIWDVDGNQYIDFVMGFGAILFGHRPPFVVESVKAQLDTGFEIGPIQALAGEVAALIRDFTGMERVAFCNTGSEAVLAALRLARTVTGRDRIATFTGDYHGIFDEVLGRPAAVNGGPRSLPIAPGIPASALDNVLMLEYGSSRSLEILAECGSELAAVLVEPVQSRRLDLQPSEFLRELKRITQKNGTALVFDEVVTGFRVHPGGAQALFGVEADIATYGKVVGGGMPIGIVAGKGRYMDALDGGMWNYGDASFPEAGVTFFAGTFVRHPLVLAAAKSVLLHLKQSGPELQLFLGKEGLNLAQKLRDIQRKFEAPIQIAQFSSLVFLGLLPEFKHGSLLFYYLRERGFHVWENRTVVLTTAHSDEDLDRFVQAFHDALQEMQSAGFLPETRVQQAAADVRSTADGPSKFSELVPVLEETETKISPIVSGRLPLTEAQKELWLTAMQGDDASRALNSSVLIRMKGELNLDVLQSRLQLLVERHDSLRTFFDSAKPEQEIVSNLHLQIPVVDLSDLAPEQQHTSLCEGLDHERKHVFELTQAPLMGTKIIKLGPSEHMLWLTFHHLVTDGWSVGVLLHELKQLYNAQCQGQAWLQPAMQHSEYVKFQSDPSKHELAKAAERYWLKEFVDIPPQLDLPSDHPRPPLKTFRASRETEWMSPQLYGAAKKVSAQQRTTLLTFLLASFKVLVYRLTGEEDIVIGIPAAGQIASSLQGVPGGRALVGHCVNFLPIRSRCSGKETFSDYLRALKAQILDAYEHQDFTFGSLVEKLRIPRDRSRLPLVSLTFNVDQALSNFELFGLETELETLGREFAVFDLEMNLVDHGNDILIECTYNKDLFEVATIKQWLRHWKTLLSEVALEPRQAIGLVKILDAEQRRQLLDEWNDTRVAYPKDKMIHELFDAQVERSPEAVAVVHEGQQLTYRELNSRANQLGHYLKKRGVGPEVLVGICMDRSVEMIVGLLGILKAGGAYVPLDPTYPPERLDFMLKDARAGVVVTTAGLLRSLPELDAQVVCLDTESDAISRESEVNLVREGTAENLAYVIYTSGSTGRPKGAPITHQNVVRLFLATDEWFGFNERDIWTLFHSYAFDFSVWELLGALIYGGRLVIVPYLVSRNPKAFYELLVREQVTVLNQTPSAFRQLIEAEDVAGQKDLAIRYIIFGGEALEMQSLRPWFERHGESQPRLVNMYGITETTVHVTYRPLSQRDLTSGSAIGRPIPDLQVYLLNDGQMVPVGIPGEMFVGGTGLGRGYLNRPELTAERFVPNPFGQTEGDRLYRTGDLARYLPDGNIEFLGRIDSQVKIRGFRIELGEIEAALCRHSSVEQAVVTCREDTGEKRLVAYFTVNTAERSIDELRNFLKSQVPEYMVPAIFVRLEKLPLTANGKVDRRALPEPVGSENPERDGYCPPRNPLELQLTKIWESLLGVERVGVKDNFFDLGGHSLLATRLIARIEKTLGKRVSLASLFQSPTIEGIAQELQEEARHLSWTPSQIEGSKQREEPLIQPRQRADQPVGLSFAQQRLWFLDQLLSGNAPYNVPTAFRLSGLLDISCLERSLNAVIGRHEVLRTTIKSVQGKPYQIVADDCGLPLAVHDLSLRPEADKESEASQVLAEEAQRPFDLAQDLMLRATLIKLSEQEHILLLVMHHIASDGWSMGILMRELSQFYEAEISGLPSSLPELPIQYADYAEWQREWLQGMVLDEQLDYWKRQLAGAPTRLDLPTDRPRPAIQSFQGASRHLELSPELTHALNALGMREKTSLFMTLLAAFQVMLFRYTGQDDIVLGSPIAGRNRGDVEDLIGFFVNTLILRTDLSENPTFVELLRRVREVALNAYDHQDLPFERLVEELQSERSLSHNPLFQVMFAFENAPGSPLQLSGLQVSPVRLVSERAHFDLTLSITERRRGLIARLSYSTDLFEDSTIERMLGHFRVLLEGAVAHPEGRLSELPLLTTEEWTQLMQWNGTRREYPRERCLSELFEAQVERSSEAVAVVYEGQQLTYRELNRQANKFGHYLRRMGIGPDLLVGICLDRSVEMIVGLLGILKAGGAYVPLDPAYPRERLDFMLKDAGVGVVVTTAALLRDLPELKAKVVCLDTDWDAISQESEANLDRKGTPQNLAYVIYTSGSTGRPKGVQIPQSAMVNLLMAVRDRSAIQPEDTLLAVTTLSFDIAGLEIYLPLVVGAKVVVAPRQSATDGPQLMGLMGKSGTTVMQATPATWRLLLSAGWKGNRGLKVLCGGEALPVHLAPDLLNRCASLWNLYGPTETTVWSTLCEAKSSDRITIGKPIANTQVYLLDEHMHTVPVGVPGELYIGGLGVGRGYLERPDLTAERFVPNPFGQTEGDRLYRTGDLARYLPDGNIEFLGRIDSQVKIRGFRIELGEIEAALCRHSSVEQAVVTCREDTGEKRLVAYFTVNTAERSIDELRNFLKSQVPEYMVPAIFVRLEKLPLTANGKVDRRALPEPEGVGGTSEKSVIVRHVIVWNNN